VKHSHAVSISYADLQGSLTYTDDNSLTGGINTGVSGIISKITAWGYYGGPASSNGVTAGININASHGHNASIGNSGGSGAHENRQPYTVVNRWKRTA
jgi:microcystin-dependent protein